MSTTGKGKTTKHRKTYAVRIAPDLMVALQHLALDEDQYTSDLLEEGVRDLLKKYHRKTKDPHQR
jgi:hypothetical protein